ncbi:hypothetical protein ADUPG1_009915 [Aduncisulcus paluster]|uniref:Thioredoxin domain-containing protein n=1 Tax=Aduncisulcus paluster TaxID=2918883 RepID=A0ABQ5KYD1_9EUKA|nr:hypothetical protein ADUPG1_009915 [Aduncisulcus paluster]
MSIDFSKLEVSADRSYLKGLLGKVVRIIIKEDLRSGKRTIEGSIVSIDSESIVVNAYEKGEVCVCGAVKQCERRLTNTCICIVFVILVFISFVSADPVFITADDIERYPGEKIVVIGKYNEHKYVFDWMKKIDDLYIKSNESYQELFIELDQPENKELLSVFLNEKLPIFFIQGPFDSGITQYTHINKYDDFVETIQILSQKPDNSHVRTFQSEEKLYGAVKKEKKPIIVKFCVRESAHCEALKPHFERASSLIDSKVMFFDVDCKISKKTTEFCNKQGIGEYPTIELFNGNSWIKYENGRSFYDLKDFALKHTAINENFDLGVVMGDEEGEIIEPISTTLQLANFKAIQEDKTPKLIVFGDIFDTKTQVGYGEVEEAIELLGSKSSDLPIHTAINENFDLGVVMGDEEGEIIEPISTTLQLANFKAIQEDKTPKLIVFGDIFDTKTQVGYGEVEEAIELLGSKLLQGIGEYPTIELFNGNSWIKYENGRSFYDLKDFALKHTAINENFDLGVVMGDEEGEIIEPISTTLQLANFKAIQEDKTPKLIVFGDIFDTKTQVGYGEVEEAIELLGSKSSDLPIVFIITPDNIQPQRYNGLISKHKIVNFIEDLLEDPDYSYVHEFVSEEQLSSLSAKKPVFVKYFERWCGHCRALKPHFAKAAEKSADQCIFLEVECSKNDETKGFCRQQRVTGYPTLQLLTTHGEWVNYQGGRSAQEMSDFALKYVSQEQYMDQKIDL